MAPSTDHFPLLKLPDELIAHVLQFLPARSLARACVNRRLLRAARAAVALHLASGRYGPPVPMLPGALRDAEVASFLLLLEARRSSHPEGRWIDAGESTTFIVPREGSGMHAYGLAGPKAEAEAETDAGSLPTANLSGLRAAGGPGSRSEPRGGRLVVQQVSTSHSHALVLSEEGKVYGLGSNDFGRLGLGPEHTCTAEPMLIDSISSHKAVHVAAGLHHSLVVTDGGLLFSFGRGKQGQLGHGSVTDEPKPRQVVGLGEVHAVSAAAGGWHSLVVGLAGELLVFGTNGYGQLGLTEKVSTMTSPTRLPFGQGARVVHAGAGTSHSLAITSTGKLFTFGEGTYGQLGHSDRSYVFEPRQVKYLEPVKVVAAAAGEMHTLVLEEKGRVLTFGYGKMGRLGHNDEMDQFTPRVVSCERSIVAVAAGCSHSLIVTDQGQVMGFGSCPPCLPESARTPVPIHGLQRLWDEDSSSPS